MAEHVPTDVNGSNPGSEGGNTLTLRFESGSRAGTSVTLSSPIVSFGRAADNDLAFDPMTDIKVSSRHGRFSFDAGTRRWLVEDLGSTNGSFIDGQRISSPTALYDGATLVLGDVTVDGGVTIRLSLAGAGAGDVIASVPPPPVPPGTESDGRDTPPPPPPGGRTAGPAPLTPAGGASQGGLFGTLRGAWDRFNERRALHRGVKDLTAQLEQARPRQNQAFAALGRELLGSIASLTELRTTAKITALQQQIEQLRGRSAEVERSIAADEQVYQDWLAGWSSSFGQLESAFVQAAEELKASSDSVLSARQAIIDALSTRISKLDEVAGQIGQLSASLKAEPHRATPEQLAGVLDPLRSATTLFEQPIENLADLTRAHGGQTDRLAGARDRHDRLTEQMKQERAAKVGRESESLAGIAAKRSEIAAFAGQVAQLHSQIDLLLPDLGQEAALLADRDALPAAPAGTAAAVAAVRHRREIEQQIETANQRLEAIK